MYGKMAKIFTFILLVATIFVIFIGQKHLNEKNNNFTKVNSQTTESADESNKTGKTENTNHKYYNKNWLAIGDSITAFNKYQGIVQNLENMKLVSTHATPGITLGQTADNLVVSPDIDLVTVFAGTNDYGLSKVLGKISDNANKDTFYGNIKNVINTIKSQNTKSEVVFITPLKRGKYSNQPVYPNPNSLGYTLDQYVDAIKEVCKSQNIKVIDLFSNSGIDQNNIQQYLTDNLHPNDQGYELISKEIVKELEQ